MVRIAAAREDRLLRLTVQDDGVGFDLDRTPRRIGLSNVGARVELTGGGGASSPSPARARRSRLR